MADTYFPSITFLWPALAAASAGEIASTFAHELAHLAGAAEPATGVAEPLWATPNTIALELTSMRLRDFSVNDEGTPALVCAPYALHFANVADFAAGHSLVAGLHDAGLSRVLVTDWRSATPDMRFLSIDSYLADLNVAVDEVGGSADLIGLCQGGWMALVYAARFPHKVRKLVLAGAPVDIAAGQSPLSLLASSTPLSLFEQLVEFGNGRMLGPRLLGLWSRWRLDSDAIRQTFQLPAEASPEHVHGLETRFRQWYETTVNLPGTYYLQVAEWLFQQNRLAQGRFVALGRPVDLSLVRTPIYLLAAREDELVAPEQIFATERRVGTPTGDIKKAIAPDGHLALFMGMRTLSTHWPKIARWLSSSAVH